MTSVTVRPILVATLLVVALLAVNAKAPNVIFIMADDLGFNEMGFMNATRGLQTPNLDALAAESMVLERYYTNPLCSPSRSALMTGIYNHRIGTQANVIYWDTPWSPALKFQFLPQYFKTAGYSTAMFGKWHLGMHKKEFYPASRGFDHHAGYMQGCGSHSTHTASCCNVPVVRPPPFNDTTYICGQVAGKDYRGYDWFVGTPLATTPDVSANLTTSSNLIAAHAEDFLAQQSATSPPFFMYLPFQNIHAPYDCQPSSLQRFASLSVPDATKIIFGYIYELDLAVGRVLAALRRTGITPVDTVIVFASDNGAPLETDVVDRNFPLASGKSHTYEGGTRVPAFIHAPSRMPPGRSKRKVHVTDWLPTLLTVAGVKPASLPKDLDGLDVWSSLLTDTVVRNELIVNLNPICNGGQFGMPKAAFILGDMKILCFCYSIAGIAGGNTTGCVGDPQYPRRWPQLFNITEDPGETNDLAKQLPQTVAELSARLAVLAVMSVEPMQWVKPYQGADYECADCPLAPVLSSPTDPWVAWL